MSDVDVALQAKHEHEAFQQISCALSRLISWEHSGGDQTSKLPGLKLIAQSFQRHLENLIKLEEKGGYLENISDAKPHLAGEIDVLHEQFEQFQALLSRIVLRLKRVSPTNLARMEVVSDELFALLSQLHEHDRQETDLLQEAFLRDEGGEG